MERTPTRQDALKTLSGLIRDIPVCMMTTTAEDGTLHSRPMVALQDEPFDGTLWFFTSIESATLDESQTTHQVNLAYVDIARNLFVSVAGDSLVNHEMARMERLWNPQLKAWFPQGLDDPDLCLLRVDIQSAHYWDAKSRTRRSIAGFVRSLTPGSKPIPGEQGVLLFGGRH